MQKRLIMVKRLITLKRLRFEKLLEFKKFQEIPKYPNSLTLALRKSSRAIKPFRPVSLSPLKMLFQHAFHFCIWCPNLGCSKHLFFKSKYNMMSDKMIQFLWCPTKFRFLFKNIRAINVPKLVSNRHLQEESNIFFKKASAIHNMSLFQVLILLCNFNHSSFLNF